MQRLPPVGGIAGDEGNLHANEDVVQRRFTLSSKTGEGVGSMHDFFQDQVMRILEPIADHVKAVEDELRSLSHRIAAADDKASQAHDRHNKVDKTLAAHDLRIEDTQVDLRPTHKAIAELGHRVSDLEGESHAQRDRITQSEGRIESVNDSMHALRKCLEDTDAAARREQTKLSQTSKLAGRLEAGLAEHKESHAGLCDRHLNLARGHQHTMQSAEAVRQDLSRLAAKLESERVEADRVLAAASQRAESLERALGNLREEVGSRGRTLDITSDDVQGLSKNLGTVQYQMQQLRLDEERGRRTEQRLSKLEEVLQRVEHNLAKELQKDLPGLVFHLQQQVAQHATEIVRHNADLQGLDGREQHHEDRLRAMEVHTWDLETRGAKLRQRADRTEAQVGSLSSQQRTAALRLDLQELDGEKAKAHRQHLDEELGDATSAIHALGNELSVQQTGIVGVRQRLDLAHEYFDGLGRGLQDTLKHVSAGSGGMLAPRPRLPSRDLPHQTLPPVLKTAR